MNTIAQPEAIKRFAAAGRSWREESGSARRAWFSRAPRTAPATKLLCIKALYTIEYRHRATRARNAWRHACSAIHVGRRWKHPPRLKSRVRSKRGL